MKCIQYSACQYHVALKSIKCINKVQISLAQATDLGFVQQPGSCWVKTLPQSFSIAHNTPVSLSGTGVQQWVEQAVARVMSVPNNTVSLGCASPDM